MNVKSPDAIGGVLCVLLDRLETLSPECWGGETGGYEKARCAIAEDRKQVVAMRRLVERELQSRNGPAAHPTYGAPEVALPDLSDRQTEILELIVLGKSNGTIGQILGISPHTVDTHVRRIFLKLDAGDRIVAAVKAVTLGLVPGVTLGADPALPHAA